MKIVDIADEIYRELSSPSGLSIPVIAFWLRSNIGALNNLIASTHAINSTTLEFEPELVDESKTVLKKLYMIHYYDIKIRATLGAASIDSVLEVTSDGATVRKINKNELSKTYIAIRKQEYDELTKAVFAFKNNASHPIQVAGDDTINGANFTPDRNSLRYY